MDRGWLLQLVDIMRGRVACRTNTDELTDQAVGTVYHCAALANRSVTPILYLD